MKEEEGRMKMEMDEDDIRRIKEIIEERSGRSI